MMATSDFQSFNSLQNLDMPALLFAELIEDEILAPIQRFNWFNHFSELNNLISQKINEILQSITSEIFDLSSRFWNKPLEDPVIIEEVLSALVLKFLSGLHNSRELEYILYEFKYSRFQELTNILKRIIASNELKSFNISRFILFTDFKYPKTISTEGMFWMSNIVAEIKNFNEYLDAFMEFITWNPLFKEHMKGLCNVNEDDFRNLFINALRSIVLVQKRAFESYGVDGFTSYDRKIYLKLFETGYPEMNKAATFYVLLYELCHYFRRISCQSLEDSRNSKTPEEIINSERLSEAGVIFEIKYFGQSHKFLNEDACKFFLTPNLNLSPKKYLKEFVKTNASKGNVYVPLRRGNFLTGQNLIEFDGCAISRYRGYS